MLGKNAVVRRAEAHSGEWISLSSIVPGANDQQIGLEVSEKRHHLLLKCGLVLSDRAARSHRNIQHVAIRSPFLSGSSAGILRRFMQRAVDNVGVGFDDRLSAIAVMHIPIENGNAIDVRLLQCIKCGDRGTLRATATQY